jgi:hypothetical protein
MIRLECDEWLYVGASSPIRAAEFFGYTLESAIVEKEDRAPDSNGNYSYRVKGKNASQTTTSN